MIRTVDIGNRKIAIKGIGKLFFQDGLPIGISISVLKQRDIEVSVLHVADECMKNGWSPKTTFNKLKVDFADGAEDMTHELNLLERFCFATYEDQREMIFEYLFNETTEQAIFNPNNSVAATFLVDYIERRYKRS